MCNFSVQNYGQAEYRQKNNAGKCEKIFLIKGLNLCKTDFFKANQFYLAQKLKNKITSWF